MSRVHLLIMGALVLGACLLWSARQPSLRRLRGELRHARAALSQQVTPVDRSDSTQATKDPELKAVQAKLDSKKMELARLRAQVSAMREQVTVTPVGIDAEIVGVKAAVEAHHSARESAEAQKHAIELGQAALITLLTVYEEIPDKDPVDWDEVFALLAESNSPKAQACLRMFDGENPEAVAGRAKLGAFEILRRPGSGTISTGNSNRPALVLRERVSRKLPDGNYERVYGRIDGAVHAVAMSQPGFVAWEAEHREPGPGR